MKNATKKNDAPIRFHTTILTAGKTATGIQIPSDVIAKLGTSKKPAVRITMNGYNIGANGKEQASRKMKKVALG